MRSHDRYTVLCPPTPPFPTPVHVTNVLIRIQARGDQSVPTFPGHHITAAS